MAFTSGPTLSGEGSFILDSPAGAGSVLRLDGAWWRVSLTLDGVPLPPVTPGLAPLDVPLPPLGAGPHRLQATVNLPGGEPPILSLPNKNRAPQAGSFTLRLQGSRALVSFAVPLVGGKAAPTFAAAGAPAGATVELAVSRDGELLSSWGPLPVDEQPRPARWAGETWEIGAAELYVATATLRDAAGAVLAESSQRIGLRETHLVDGRFALDGAVTPLVAVRGQPTEDPGRVAALVASAGLDAVELHGAIAPSAWFAPFDEWGLPIVQIARCDGKLWTSGEDTRSSLSRYAEALAEQDTRLLAAAAARPSVVAWACEGADTLRAVACGDLHRDPLTRPIFGVDVPGVSISGTFAPAAAGPAWILELGHPHGGMLPAPSVAAQTFLTGVGPRGSGGVIPAPETTEGAAWAPAWSAAARKLGAPAWVAKTRRASSIVSVTGLAPGQIVVVHAPWIAPTGAAADTTGTARVSIWYEGAAKLVVSGVEHPITVVADRWEGTRRVAAGGTVDARGW